VELDPELEIKESETLFLAV